MGPGPLVAICLGDHLVASARCPGEAYLPANMEETVLNTLVMLMGIVVMAFLVGELSNILGNFDPVGTNSSRRYRQNFKLPFNLRASRRGREVLRPLGRVYPRDRVRVWAENMAAVPRPRRALTRQEARNASRRWRGGPVVGVEGLFSTPSTRR